MIIDVFFDNVHSGDFRKQDNGYVHCGDFSTFFFLNAKIRNTKIPTMRCAKWGFWSYSGTGTGTGQFFKKLVRAQYE